MSLKQFSTKEVEEHNDDKSTWVIIHNKIYDVTAYLNEHPGGEEVLLEEAGKDATEAFEHADHSSDARELMKKYQIGELVEEERKPFETKKLTSEKKSVESKSSIQSKVQALLLPISLGILAGFLIRKYFLHS